jgi:hypothetical protein
VFAINIAGQKPDSREVQLFKTTKVHQRHNPEIRNR